MKLYCVVNELKPEHVKDYSEYHRNAHKTEWKTQLKVLREAGMELCNVYIWRNYAIMVVGCEDLDECYRRLATMEDNLRWQELMSGFFAGQPKFDGTETISLEQIFDLAEQSKLCSAE
ncbi:L-rhamnose mutarotase [Christensenella tenuis]|uniref:L-rhamnose mutarotase n=1 Tax=Christensenella tenuis TaxID=2763033 RepID=A0ABR7EEN0_9FIRM|nr:L-rhamnose mutarotase [Christensenella tenuis]MBC5647623.1 L-rhamnose mutarotase [Christensenella tenuis]